MTTPTGETVRRGEEVRYEPEQFVVMHGNSSFVHRRIITRNVAVLSPAVPYPIEYDSGCDIGDGWTGMLIAAAYPHRAEGGET